MKKWLNCIVLWGTLCLSLDAAVIQVPSMSRTDMVNSLASAAHGDTLVFPAGTANYSSPVAVSKAVTMRFVPGQSIITNVSGGENTYILTVNTARTNDPIRITGLTAHGRGTSSGIYVGANQRNVRIDHCNFSNMRIHAIYYQGFESYGVVDHCSFTNHHTAIEISGAYGGNSWNFALTPFGLGTTNCVTVENCYFENNNATLVADLNNVIYTSYGGRADFRQNEIQGKATTQSTVYWDSHGNNSQQPWSDTSLRGTVFAVNSSNIINCPTSYRHFYLRGGCQVLVGNTITGAPNAAKIVLTEEEGWYTDAGYTIVTKYPADDQITNTWIVGNTYNGLPITADQIRDDMQNPLTDRFFIQEGRDFWVTNQMPPASIYTPLIYPHPRVTADDAGVKPAPPANLRFATGN